MNQEEVQTFKSKSGTEAASDSPHHCPPSVDYDDYSNARLALPKSNFPVFRALSELISNGGVLHDPI